MTEKSWAKNDELFLKELKQGHQWQSLPAMYFQLHGCTVEMPDLSIRSSIKEAGKWINSEDLIVNGFILEIKSRNEAFTSPSSFPYETALVDTVAGYQAKEHKPLAYIMVSRPTGAMLCLKSSSPGGWTTQNKFDHIRKIEDTFYLCNKRMLQPLNMLLDFILKQK